MEIQSKQNKYGIQGGKGSFNEQAILKYFADHLISNYQIDFLYTTANVLSALSNQTIDYGFFAYVNTIAGLVEETQLALTQFQVHKIDEITIQICHYLMKQTDISTNQISQIMAHPQVLNQCQKTLINKYPNLPALSGTGYLVDTAVAAQALFEGNIDSTTAILGPIGLAKLYDLEIIDNNLQDNPKNQTTFWLVDRL